MITLLLASINFTFSILKTDNKQSVILSRVIDGDTIEINNESSVRLVNINSPEKGAIGYNLSMTFLKSFENKELQIEILGKDKYKRLLAKIYSPDYINLEIVNLGLASKFLVQEDELNIFADAEEKAIESEKGIWIKSEYTGCFKSKINFKEEYIQLFNICSPINITGWFLKDESRKIFKLKGHINKEIKVHSQIGKDNETDLFWNLETDIWNNDRDTLYLFDRKGNIVHHEVYGY